MSALFVDMGDTFAKDGAKRKGHALDRHGQQYRIYKS
jgi:hypothetical protein